MCKKTCIIKEYPINSIFYRANQNNDLPFDTISNNINGSEDWENSIYFALDESVADGYWVDGGHPYKMEICNKHPLKYILCTHECFKSGNYKKEMESIISEIEELLGQKKPKDIPFMKWLGMHEYAFQCYHNEGDNNMEIAIPNSMVRKDMWEIMKSSEKKSDSKYQERIRY